MTRAGGLLAALLLAVTSAAGAQSESLRRAAMAYEELDYAGAIVAAREALRDRLSEEDRVRVYELLGYAYGALDSTRQAVGAFQQLIFLAPDREPDVERVSPRITSLYASALGQVLVVRRLSVDSASFVAGAGSATVRFEVSRTAQAVSRIRGPGKELAIDSQVVAGAARFEWPAIGANGRPLPPGTYDIVVTAREAAREEYASRPLAVRITHGELDTLPHLRELPGYKEQQEMVSPPRDWRPAALAVLYTGVIAGAFFALDDGQLGTGSRTALASVSGAAVTGGIVLSLRRPEPRPSATNILYNRLLRDLLARRNAQIASENADRRTKVRVTIAPIK
jgi:hypothetical protein